MKQKPKTKAKKTDFLLMILALIVLAAGLTGIVWRNSIKAVPVLVFTLWWHNDLEPGVLEGLIGEFEQSRENVKVVLNSRSYEEVRKLLFDYAYNENPDPISGDEADMPESPGDILALDQLWISSLSKNGVLDPARPPPEPLVSFFHPLFYNIEMLKNAGFSRPPRTRSELLEYAGAVSSPGAGRYGIGFALGEQNSKGVYGDIYPWFWASGVSLIEGGRAFTETLDFFSRLRRDNIIHPQTFIMNEEEKQEAFINNRIAFMTGSIQDIETLRRKMGEDAFSVSIVPGADSYVGKPVFGVSDWSLGVFRGSAHQEEAAAFISFMAEKSSFLAEKARGISGPDLSDMYPADADPLYSKVRELYIAGDLNREFSGTGETGLGISETERETIFREELLDLFAENQTPSSAAAAIRTRWGL